MNIVKILPTDSRTAMITTTLVPLTNTSVTLAPFNEGLANGSASDSIQLLAGGTEIKVNKTTKFFVDLSTRIGRTGTVTCRVFMFIQKVSTGVINEEEVLAASLRDFNNASHLQIGKFFDWNAGESYQIGCFRDPGGTNAGDITPLASTASFLPATQPVITDPSTRLTIYEVLS